jgi:hypothetical protein
MRKFLQIVLLTLLPAAAFAQPSTKVEVGPAAPAPGIFTMKKSGAALHLSVTGHSFTAKPALENYLAYRAAEATLDNRMHWFGFVEHRAKSDTVMMPKGDPAGPRFSFRMDYFRPQWRWRVAGSPAWQSWSPFSGKPFPNLGDPDLKSAIEFQLSADIVMHKGMVDDVSPLAFDAGALSDYLVNQVEAPK